MYLILISKAAKDIKDKRRIRKIIFIQICQIFILVNISWARETQNSRHARNKIKNVDITKRFTTNNVSYVKRKHTHLKIKIELRSIRVMCSWASNWLDNSSVTSSAAETIRFSRRVPAPTPRRGSVLIDSNGACVYYKLYLNTWTIVLGAVTISLQCTASNNAEKLRKLKCDYQVSPFV